MIACNDAQLLLAVADALDPDEAEQLQAHLATCPDCQRLAQDLAEMQDGFALLRAPLPQGFHETWQSALHDAPPEPQEIPKKRPQLVPLSRRHGTAVAACFLLLLGAIAFRGLSFQSPSSLDANTPTGFALEEQAPDTASLNGTEDARRSAIPLSPEEASAHLLAHLGAGYALSDLVPLGLDETGDFYCFSLQGEDQNSPLFLVSAWDGTVTDQRPDRPANTD